MPTDNLPKPSDTLSVAATDESMPDAPEWIGILDSYIEDALTKGVHDDGACFGRSDCRLIQKALRMMGAAIQRARQAGEPDPVFA